MKKALEKFKFILKILETNIPNKKKTQFIYESCNEAIVELKALETKDRLTELEKVILDYYLSKGYEIGVGGWSFRVIISTWHKAKEIQIKFAKNRDCNPEDVFRFSGYTTKEMFDRTFEYFTIKDKQ